jgi:hypothetical protein
MSLSYDFPNGQQSLSHNLISVIADLGIKIGDIGDHLKKQDRLRKEAARYSQPSFYVYSDQCVISNGFGIVRLTGPDQGHVWYPQGLNFFTTGGAGVETSMPGRAEMFISGADHRSKTALNQFSPVDWRDTIPNLPTVIHYSRAQINLRFNEEMYITFTGATNALTYGASIWLLDYEEAAIRQEWTL